MTDMAKPTNGEHKATLEERKANLEAELDKIQREIGGSWEEIKRQLKARSHPKNWLNKYPIASVGVAFLAGMWLARDRSRKPVEVDPDSIRRLLFNELKHVAVQRFARAAMHRAEDAIDQWREEQKES